MKKIKKVVGRWVGKSQRPAREKIVLGPVTLDDKPIPIKTREQAAAEMAAVLERRRKNAPNPLAPQGRAARVHTSGPKAKGKAASRRPD